MRRDVWDIDPPGRHLPDGTWQSDMQRLLLQLASLAVIPAIVFLINLGRWLAGR